MNITGFDHIVLCVRDLAQTRDFFTSVPGMRKVEERPGKYALHFGPHKISLQDAAAQEISACSPTRRLTRLFAS